MEVKRVIGSSLCNLFMRNCKAQPLCFFLGKPYGDPRTLREFVWIAARRKILTAKNLIKIFFSMVSWCCMCHCSKETVDHLLIHCNMAFELWSFIFRMFGVQWVLQENVLDLLCGWQGRGPTSDI